MPYTHVGFTYYAAASLAPVTPCGPCTSPQGLFNDELVAGQNARKLMPCKVNLRLRQTSVVSIAASDTTERTPSVILYKCQKFGQGMFPAAK